MNFEEHAAKPLLAAVDIDVPSGRLATSAEQARAAAESIGACVVKAQVPVGKRGKAGGIRLAASPDEAAAAADAILGMEIGGYRVERLLVEAQMPIARELYAAVITDAASKGPMVMFSLEGGMDIEELAVEKPEALLRREVDIEQGFSLADAHAMLDSSAGLTAELGAASDHVAATLANLYRAFVHNDAELLEINPLAVLEDHRVVALDCKFTLEDSATVRQPELVERGTPDPLTALEQRAQKLALKYIELGGNVGVLANGAGLTMTTMDVIRHHGGEPANFLEIGGESYTKATPALELVLDNPRVDRLVVNFCGAFARTDVMTGGVIDAIEALRPRVPIYFAIHGTGAPEARAMLKERLDRDTYPTMDAAIAACVNG